MKSSKFLLLPILAGVQLALANGGSHNEPKPTNDPRAVASSSNVLSNNQSTSVSSSVASESNSSASVQASTGDSTSSSNSGGNSVSNSTVYKQRQQAPGVFTSAGNATAPCQADWRIGASAGIGGLSFGKNHTVRDCVLQDAADAELLRGNLEASIKLRCRISFYKAALGEDCEALLNTQGKREETFATKEEVNLKVEKAFKASVSK